VPASYPPLQPQPDAQWLADLEDLEQQQQPEAPNNAGTPTSPLTQALGLIGLPNPTQRYMVATSFTPPLTGIQLVAVCVDPTAADPTECSLIVNGTQPLVNASKVCLWGRGEDCSACPSGALCPGGAVLLPKPGYWCPLVSSPPSDLQPCPQPDALLRCPGYGTTANAQGGYGCGVGFRGQLCAACAGGYYRFGGSCAPCPTTSLLISLLTPVAYFVGGLVAFGAFLSLVLLTAMQCSRRRWGGCRSHGTLGIMGSKEGSARGVCDIFGAVGELVLWFWLSAQSLAALFKQSEALAPAALIPFFRSVGVIQFSGITLDPACYTSIPFQSFWVAVGGVGGGALLLLAGLALLHRAQRPVLTTGTTLCLKDSQHCYDPAANAQPLSSTSRSDAASANAAAAPPTSNIHSNCDNNSNTFSSGKPHSAPWIASTLILLASLILTLGYGAITGIFSSAVYCTYSSPMAVADYLAAVSDGSSLRAQFPSAPPLEVLKSTALAPLAALPEYNALLHTTIPVSVLASDPYQVCGEGPHRVVRPIAIIFSLLYTLGLPAAGFCLLWANGRLKCLTRCWKRALLGSMVLGIRHKELTTSSSCSSTTTASPTPLYTQGEQKQPEQHTSIGLLKATALAALLDPNLLPSRAWTVFYEMSALAVITGCQTIVQANGSARLPSSLFYLAQSVMAAVCFASAAILGAGWGGLYAGRAHAWKQSAKVGLNVVAAAAALVNALLFGRVGSEFSRLALAATLLVLLAVLVLNLLISWGFSVHQTLPLQHLTDPESRGEKQQQEVVKPRAVVNPLAALNQRGVRCRPLYELCDTGDGEVFWWCEATGDSAWSLPVGGDSVCGWAYVGPLRGGWRHEKMGMVSDSAYYIQRHSRVRMLALVQQQQPPKGEGQKEDIELLGTSQAALPIQCLAEEEAAREAEAAAASEAVAAAAAAFEAEAAAAATAASAAAATKTANEKEEKENEKEEARRVAEDEKAAAEAEQARKVRLELLRLEGFLEERAKAEALHIEEPSNVPFSHAETLASSTYYTAWHNKEHALLPGAQGLVQEIQRFEARRGGRGKKEENRGRGGAAGGSH
jgi:hypothetical protein